MISILLTSILLFTNPIDAQTFIDISCSQQQRIADMELILHSRDLETLLAEKNALEEQHADILEQLDALDVLVTEDDIKLLDELTDRLFLYEDAMEELNDLIREKSEEEHEMHRQHEADERLGLHD